MSGTNRSRHLEWEAFQTRIDDGPPSLEQIDGRPPASLFIDPFGSRIGIRLYGTVRDLPTSPLAEIVVRPIGNGKSAALELATGSRGLYRDFYQMACVIADRVQLEHQSIDQAVLGTFRAWAALLRRKILISEDEQVGLIGELLFLHRIAKLANWGQAASAWHGPQSEEHDFTFAKADVEVKCTRGESRIHCVSSLTQLVPKPRRKLFLASIQITRSAPSRDSFSLASLIAQSLAGTAGRDHDLIRSQLEGMGWKDEDNPHYQQPYRLRAPVTAIPVDSRFPAITPAVLRFTKRQLARLDRATYWVNVDHLGVSDDSNHFRKWLTSLVSSR